MDAENANTEKERAAAKARSEAIAAKDQAAAPKDESDNRAASDGTSPCVTSKCGPVHVKGYYRKDGTYVRPHTRRR